MRFFFIWSPQPWGPWKWTWSYSNQIFTINKKALWFLQGTEGQEIPIRWPLAWFQIQPFYQEAILSNLWRRFWKLKGVRYWKTIPKIVKERFHYFVTFFFFFPFGNKEFGGVSFWQCIRGLKTFISFAKLPKNSLSPGKGHLNTSYVHSRHGMFHKCNYLLTWRFQLQWDKECELHFSQSYVLILFCVYNNKFFHDVTHGSGWWNLIPGKNTMELYNTKKVNCFPLC